MCSQQNTGATELYWVRIFSCEDTRVSFSFLPKGGQNEIVWIIGGASMYLCAKHVAN